MRRDPTELDGLQLLTAGHFPDERGSLVQSWVGSELAKQGIPSGFRQAIQTISAKGVVRGLHFQWDPPMGKLLRCVHGAILDVVVDVRRQSPTFGDHASVELTSDNRKIFWIPPGFAHGFMALADDTIVLYECTAEHSTSNEGGILWNDPALGITWPALEAIVSKKDASAPTLAAWASAPGSPRF
jgi:dTDP-4-dehydrorhamnose 3,5-epimerase